MPQELGEFAGAHARECEIEKEPQERSARSLRARLAGGVIDVDRPSLELGPHAPGKAAAWGDETRGQTRRFESVAHDHGDQPGLLALVGSLDQLDSRHGGADGLSFLIEAPPPMVGGLRGPHDLARQPKPRLNCRTGSGAGIIPNSVSLDSQDCKELAQPKLRMARLIGDGRPTRGIEVKIKSGENDSTFIKAGNDAQQIGSGANRTGRAGGDDRTIGATGFEPRCLTAKQQTSPRSVTHEAPFGHLFRQTLADNGQEVEHRKAMLGKVGAH